MFAKSIRIATFLLTISVFTAVGAIAEVAPPGSFLRKGTDQVFLPEPPGNFRTRLAWLFASRIAYETSSSINPIFGTATIGRFDGQIRREAAHFAGLQGTDHYRYAEAFVRDLALLEIQMKENGQLERALWAFGEGIIADVAAEILMAGASNLVPEGPLVDLGNLHLVPGTEANFAYRKALQDMELRYRMLIDRSLFEAMEEKLAQGAISAADVQELVSGSAISAAIGTAMSAYSGNPQQSFDVLRSQMVLDVSAHGCACALKEFDPGAAYQTHVAFFGSSGDFRTPLAFLLSQELSPPQTTLLNLLGAPAIRGLLAQERAKIDDMKTNNQDAFATYLRSLLVDIELLEKLQLDALQSGTAMSFFEGTGLNILFGAAASAVVPGPAIAATIVSTVANAAYGAKVNYETSSEAIRIRVRMAALRESTLDSLLPLSSRCGCGAGVVAAPRRAVQGTASSGQ